MRKNEIITLRASAAVATATTETGSAVEQNRVYRELIVVLDVTVAAADGDDTLDVYVDTSFDGGVTWINIGHFTQVLGNGGVKKFVMAWSNASPPASGNSIDATADQAAGVSIQRGFGDNLRYRGVTVDPSGSNIGFTYSVKGYLKQ